MLPRDLDTEARVHSESLGQYHLAYRMEVTLKLRLLITFQHSENDLANRFQRSENTKNSSNKDISHF